VVRASPPCHYPHLSSLRIRLSSMGYRIPGTKPRSSPEPEPRAGSWIAPAPWRFSELRTNRFIAVNKTKAAEGRSQSTTLRARGASLAPRQRLGLRPAPWRFGRECRLGKHPRSICKMRQPNRFHHKNRWKLLAEDVGNDKASPPVRFKFLIPPSPPWNHYFSAVV
jgi:hypothetical protein